MKTYNKKLSQQESEKFESYINKIINHPFLHYHPYLLEDETMPQVSIELWFGDASLVLLDDRRAVIKTLSPLKQGIIVKRFSEKLETAFYALLNYKPEIKVIVDDSEIEESEVEEVRISEEIQELKEAPQNKETTEEISFELLAILAFFKLI